MIISEHPQNSDEWIKERLGIPSASNFDKIINLDGSRSKQRKGYMYQLAGEIITGEQHKGYYGKAMERGHERENESRLLFKAKTGFNVETTGFIFKDEKKLFGCSPDGMIFDREEGFETKNKEPHIQAKYLVEGWKGSEHFYQVQGCMLVTGFKKWYLCSYCRGMKQVVLEIERDDEFCRTLEAELIIFNRELQGLVEKLKQ